MNDLSPRPMEIFVAACLGKSVEVCFHASRALSLLLLRVYRMNISNYIRRDMAWHGTAFHDVWNEISSTNERGRDTRTCGSLAAVDD